MLSSAEATMIVSNIATHTVAVVCYLLQILFSVVFSISLYLILVLMLFPVIKSYPSNYHVQTIIACIFIYLLYMHIYCVIYENEYT